LTGTMGYIWYDKEARKMVEDSVPYSKNVFQYIFDDAKMDFGFIGTLGTKTEPTAIKTEPIAAKAKPIVINVEPIAPKAEPIAPKVEPIAPKVEPIITKAEPIATKDEPIVDAKPQQESKISPSQPLFKTPAVPAPPVVKSAPPVVKSVPSSPPRAEPEIKEFKQNTKAVKEAASTHSTVRDSAQLREAAVKKENDLLAKCVTSAAQMAADLAHSALRSQVELETCIRRHTSRIKKAMNNEDLKLADALWAAVTRDFDRKTAVAKKASEDMANVEAALHQLETAIEKGRQNKATQHNTALPPAQRQLHDLRFDLSAAATALRQAQSEANLVHQYQDLVAKGKAQFQKELASVVFEEGNDDIAGGFKNGSLTEDQLNRMVAYAHRRVEQLQQRIVELQSLDSQRLDQALEQQRVDLDKIHRSGMESQLSFAKDQFQLDKETWETSLRAEWETELRRELARQAAAHSDHLAQVLAVQSTEIARRAEHELHEHLVRERDTFQEALGTWTARVSGIEAAVEGRALLEKQARHAQELWLAAHSLEALVRYGGGSGSGPRPLASVMVALEAAAADEPSVLAVAAAVPVRAKTRGVWTEEALKLRFARVRQAAAGAALLPETGFNLAQYAASRLYGLLSFADGPPLAEPSAAGKEEDTLALLRSAEHHLQLGELETALRFMCQLRGQSRVLASDWIQEARLHLETRQTAQLIGNMAAALGIGSL